MNHLEKLFTERDTLSATATAADEAVASLTSRIKAAVFPSEILDEKVEVQLPCGNYEVVIQSRLEWNQDELVRLAADPECGPVIKERLSVSRKDYDGLPPSIKSKFNDAVKRKAGSLKIKKI